MQLLIIQMSGADFGPESEHLSYYVIKTLTHDNNVSLAKYQRDSVTFNLCEITTQYISSSDTKVEYNYKDTVSLDSSAVTCSSFYY